MFSFTTRCIMICKNWNGSIFSEYYIIDFYTPTGLNEFCKGYNGLFSISGIRIFHIDAEIEIDDTSVEDYIGEGEDRPGEGIKF